MFWNNFVYHYKKEYGLICGKITHTFKCLKYISMSKYGIDLDADLYRYIPIAIYFNTKICNSGYFLVAGLWHYSSYFSNQGFKKLYSENPFLDSALCVIENLFMTAGIQNGLKWCGSLGWAMSHKAKGHGCDSWSGHMHRL